MKKNKGGRPLKFSTPADLQKVIDKYFKSTSHEQYTITGLALEVGSKQLIQDYEDREGYKEIIHRAKLIVENAYEIALRKHGRSGDIFALKNFGWHDVKEVEHSGQPEEKIVIVYPKDYDKDKSVKQDRAEAISS